MNINPFAVMWICIFTLKLFGLIDLTWWLVAPMAILAALSMMADRK